MKENSIINPLKHSRRFGLASSLAIAALMLPVAGYSATVNLTSLPSSSQDWNTASIWSDGQAPSAANDYVVGSGYYLRVGAAGTTTTFGGNSLTFNGDGTKTSNGRALIKLQGTSSGTVNGDITLNAGWLDFAPNSGTSLASASLDFNHLNVTANANVAVGAYTEKSSLVGILTGTGNLDLSLDNAAISTAQTVYFSDLSGYTGAFTVTGNNLGIEFGVDYTFANSLTLNSGTFLDVDSGQTLTFTEGDLIDSANGTVAAGTYSGSSLDALGANYVNNGGTLVVKAVPEPSSMALASLGGGLMLLLGCRKKRK